MSSSAVSRRKLETSRSAPKSPSPEKVHSRHKKSKKTKRHHGDEDTGISSEDEEKRHKHRKHHKHHGKKRRREEANGGEDNDADEMGRASGENVSDNDEEIREEKEHREKMHRRQDDGEQHHKNRGSRRKEYDRSFNDRNYRDVEYERDDCREDVFRGRDRYGDSRDRDYYSRDYRDRQYGDRDYRGRGYRDRNNRNQEYRDRSFRDTDRNIRDRDYGDRDEDQRNDSKDRDRDRRYGANEDRYKERNDKLKTDSEKPGGDLNEGNESRSKGQKDSDAKKTADPKDNSASSQPGAVKPVTESQKKVVDMLTSKTGGAYIPPAKLKMMQAQITDKNSAAYQRIAWEALKKSIHGHINKVNTGNLGTIVRELLKENLVRGCGLLCRSIIQAQAASPTFTKVYAALVAVINSRFPQIGELLLKRVVIQFKRGFRRNDKSTCISAATFIAHLVNQDVAHELLALEILVLLMENPTSDSVEVAIAFLKEVVEKLLQVAKKGTMAIQDMLRNILHEGTLDKRVQYMIEVMFQMIKVGGTKKEGEEEDQLEGLVDEEDQITHIINLDDATDGQDILNVFKLDPDYEANEAAYKKLREEILGSESESGEEGSGDDEDSSGGSNEEGESKGVIIDMTETNLVALRRTIYLTIQSSLDFEECAHKLLRMQLKPGQEMEMCHMILDCCAEMRSYEKFFGLLAQRFCMINKMYVGPFQQIFIDSYATIHRLEINKLRNVAKLFAHLLFTHAISWEVLSTCKLTEEDSTSSSRIFVKILFQELSEYMGLGKLNDQLKDPTLQPALEGLFPRDDPRNTRFAINFFTSIGLGGLTDDLREHLKSQPKTPVAQLPIPADAAAKSSTSSSSTSDSSSSSDSSSDSD